MWPWVGWRRWWEQLRVPAGGNGLEAIRRESVATGSPGLENRPSRVDAGTEESGRFLRVSEAPLSWDPGLEQIKIRFGCNR